MLWSGIVLVLLLFQQILNNCTKAAEDFDITTVYRFQRPGYDDEAVSDKFYREPKCFYGYTGFEYTGCTVSKGWRIINNIDTLIATPGDKYQELERMESKKLKPLPISWLNEGFVLSVDFSRSRKRLFSLILSTGDNSAISDLVNISFPMRVHEICKNYNSNERIMKNEARRCTEFSSQAISPLPSIIHIFIERSNGLKFSSLNSTDTFRIGSAGNDFLDQIGYIGVDTNYPDIKFHLWKPVNMLALVQSNGAIELRHSYRSEAYCIAVEHYLQPGSGAKLLLKAVLGNGTELTIGAAEAQQSEEDSPWKTQVFLWDKDIEFSKIKLIAEKKENCNVFIKEIRKCTSADDSNLSTFNRESSVEVVTRHNALGLPLVTQDGRVIDSLSQADFEPCSSVTNCSWEINNMEVVKDTSSPLGSYRNKTMVFAPYEETVPLPFIGELEFSFKPQSSSGNVVIFLLEKSDNDDLNNFYQIVIKTNAYGYSRLEKCTTTRNKQQQCNTIANDNNPVYTWSSDTWYYFTVKFSQGSVQVYSKRVSNSDYWHFNWRDSSPLDIKHFKIGIENMAGTVYMENFDAMWYLSSVEGSMKSKPFIPSKGKVCVSVVYKGLPGSIELELRTADGISRRLLEKQSSDLGRGWERAIYNLNLEGLNVKSPVSLYLNAEASAVFVTWIKRVAECDVEGNGHILSSSSGLLNMDFIWYDVAVNSSSSLPQEPMECLNGGVFEPERNICICPAGFTGPTCEYGCGMDRFGLKCDVRCSKREKGCMEMKLCRPRLGCNCAPGYKGLLCDIRCDSGEYGANCSQTCGHCNRGTCDSYTGQCSGGCSGDYYPPLCQHSYKYLKTAPEVISFDSDSMSIEFDIKSENLEGRGTPKFYQLQIRDNEDAQWRELTPALLPTEDTVYTNISHTGLQYSNQIRVVLLDIDGSSYQGQKVPITTVFTECTVPSEVEYNLYAESVKENEFEIKWKLEPEDSTWCLTERFEVEEKVDSTWRSHYKGKEASCIFSKLLRGETYEVRVRAITSNGPLPFSQPLSFTTKEKAPGAVSSLQVSSVLHDQLEITWNKPVSSSDVSKYKVSYHCLKLLACPEEYCSYSSGEIEVATTAIRLRGLLSLAQYSISVQASGAEDGPQSHKLAATDMTVPNVAPSPSETPVMDRTNSSFTVHWEPPKNCTMLNGFLEGYRYELKGPNSAVYEGSTTNTSATFTRLAPQTEYTVNIYVVATGGSNANNALEIIASTRATVPGHVERLTVYKTGRRIIGVRWALPNETYGQLRSFTITHTAEGQPAVSTVVKPSQCVAWPDLYCYNLRALLPDTKYNVAVQARNMEIEEDGEVAEVTALTKEYAPEAPIYIRIVSETETNLTIEWGLPNMLNGVLRSFLVSVEQTDSYNSTDCCQYFPIQEVTVNHEQANYQIQLQELRPAATYAISVSAKTMALGPAVSVTAHTRPPVPSMDGMIEPIAGADLTISSKPSFTIHPYTERGEMVSSYLLLVIPQAAETEVPETLIWNEDIEKLLSREVNGTFYVAAELNKEDIEEKKGQVTVGVPDGIKRGKWSGFFNPELKQGEKYCIGLALILQYCGVFNVGFVQTDVLTVN